MAVSTQQEATELLDERLNSGKTISQQVGLRISLARAMYEGQQWIGSYMDRGVGSAATGMQWLKTNFHPDSKSLLATVNRIVSLIQQCKAATYPDKMECDVAPGDRDTGVEALHKAEVLEALVNVLIELSGYTQAARTANLRRCIDGTHIMGWGIKVQPRMQKLRNGGEQQMYDQVLRAFTADSTRLYLDPGIQELDLHAHDDVLYNEVWTVDRARRDLGIEIDDSNCQTLGELLAREMHYNAMTQGRLYAHIPTYSRTKAVQVHQLHLKDETGRFSRMLVGVKLPRDPKATWINWDNPSTPFGGCGLPLTMLHGHQRADSMWSASDVSMMKEDQERLNTLASFMLRMVQNISGSWKWRIAEEAMKGQDPDQFKSQFNTTHAGPIFYNQGSKDRPVPPPEIQQLPAPPGFLHEMMNQYHDDMKGQVHRPDITMGALKTHTPNSSYQSASQAAGQVLGNRVRDDMTRHEWLLGVGLGTMVKLAKAGSPSVLATLHRAGFDEDDFAVISETDENYPACTITLRESSIRYRSLEEKTKPLWDAVTAQAIEPKMLRSALASLDIPLDSNDRAMYANAQKAVRRVILGAEWTPIMLGEWSDMFLDAFRMGLFDKRARNNPATTDRLQRAIQSQKQFALAETQMQAMAENPQPPQPQQMPPEESAEQEQPEAPQAADLNSLLTAIQQGSMGGEIPAAQPA